MNESTSSWWRQLAPRERRLISWGGAGLLAALSYAYLWQPLSTERVKLSASLPQMRSDAASMAFQAEEVAHLRKSTRTVLNGPALQAAIMQALNEAGMDAKSVEVTLLDEHRVSISIPKAPFDGWVALATRLQSEKQIHLESCSIEALAEAGMIQIRAMMETKNQTAL